MPFIQETYGERQRAGLPGLIVNMETQNSITRICEEVAGIGFGLPAVQGVSDKGVLLPDSFAYSAAGAAVAGNTGNGTITAVPAVGAGVKEGEYVLTLIEPAANGGVFEMEDPDGDVIGTVDVGVPATLGGVGPITATDGGVDYAAGDQFRITVTATAGGGAFRGITIRDPTLVRREGQTVDLYQKGDSLALLPAGVIWVTAGAAVAAGDAAFFNPATNRYTNNPAHFAIPNGSFDTSAGNGDLVQLRVSHL